MYENLFPTFDDLPHNLSAERSVLAHVLLGGDKARDEAVAALSIADFYIEQHKRIFKAISEMAEKGISVDLASLDDYLSRLSPYNTAHRTYLLELGSDIFALANFKTHVSILKTAAMRRDLIMLSASIAGKAFTDDNPRTITSYINEMTDRISKDKKIDWVRAFMEAGLAFNNREKTLDTSAYHEVQHSSVHEYKQTKEIEKKSISDPSTDKEKSKSWIWIPVKDMQVRGQDGKTLADPTCVPLPGEYGSFYRARLFPGTMIDGRDMGGYSITINEKLIRISSANKLGVCLPPDRTCSPRTRG